MADHSKYVSIAGDRVMRNQLLILEAVQLLLVAANSGVGVASTCPEIDKAIEETQTAITEGRQVREAINGKSS